MSPSGECTSSVSVKMQEIRFSSKEGQPLPIFEDRSEHCGHCCKMSISFYDVNS